MTKTHNLSATSAKDINKRSIPISKRTLNTLHNRQKGIKKAQAVAAKNKVEKKKKGYTPPVLHTPVLFTKFTTIISVCPYCQESDINYTPDIQTDYFKTLNHPNGVTERIRVPKEDVDLFSVMKSEIIESVKLCNKHKFSVESNKRTWESQGDNIKTEAAVLRDNVAVVQAIRNTDSRKKKQEKKKAAEVLTKTVNKVLTLEDF